MTKVELIRHLALQLERPQTEIRKLYDSTVDVFRDKLYNGVVISIPKFGVFSTALKAQHISYNPGLKKKILIPTKNQLTFKPSSLLKEKLKFRRIEDVK
ncbi:MAG: HU family DNA-binding protein [Ignavibacteriales bacterium]|nr:HU family DNA-binding protein [Ignavibacteriales bacterium]